MGMSFDPGAARRAVDDVAATLENPNVSVADLKAAWRTAYLHCGHKALGRLMIGKSVDEACKSFER